MSKFCTQCGYEAEDHNKFCPGCGTSLRDAGDSPPVFLPSETRQTASGSASIPPGGVYSQTYTESRGFESSDPNAVTPDKLVVEPVVAVLLTFLIAGLGQMINGQVGKGFAMLGALIFLSIVSLGTFSLPGFILICIDAYMSANALKQGRTIGKWSFMGSTK
ncbi:MAG: zinc ribbon domain-containing protein [Clostridiales bacterium]|nr:zinc ribbon domain-containing protein [Clostridiales bacterium]